MKISKKERQTKILMDLMSSKFYPLLISLGFTQDEPVNNSDRILHFRKTDGSIVKIFTLCWFPNNLPRFSLKYSEVPISGIKIHHRMFSAYEVAAGAASIPHASIRPIRGLWFDYKKYRKGTSSIEQGCEALVQDLLSVIPNVERLWANKESTSNFVIFSGYESSPEPEPLSVKVQPVKVAPFRLIFTNRNIWFRIFICIALPIASLFFIGLSFDNPYPLNIWEIIWLVSVSSICGTIAGVIVLEVLKLLIIFINGGPFRNGDVVQILVGKYKDEIGQIYQEVPFRGEVRVYLGHDACVNYSDIFTVYQIVKVKT